MMENTEESVCGATALACSRRSDSRERRTEHGKRTKERMGGGGGGGGAVLDRLHFARFCWFYVMSLKF